MARVNEIVNYLSVHMPGELDKIRQRDAQHAEALITDLAGVSSPATKIRAEVAIKALRSLEEKIPPLMARVVIKARKSRERENWAALATMFAGTVAGVSPFFPTYLDWLKVLAPVLTALGSFLTWSSKRETNSIFDQTRGAQVTVLVDAGTSIQQWTTDLVAYLEPSDSIDYTEKAEQIIEQANLLFRDVNRIALDI